VTAEHCEGLKFQCLAKIFDKMLERRNMAENSVALIFRVCVYGRTVSNDARLVLRFIARLPVLDILGKTFLSSS
jgi:hypothetical protein